MATKIHTYIIKPTAFSCKVLPLYMSDLLLTPDIDWLTVKYI